MAYDFTKKLQPIGQADTMSCWAACISWWTLAMAMTRSGGRWGQDQLSLLSEFGHLVSGDGGMSTSAIRRVCEDSKIRAKIKYITPAEFKSYENLGGPLIVIFKYPEVGGTHMNVIFSQVGKTVGCMEPYYPMNPSNGRFVGKYFRRNLSFFCGAQEVGIGFAKEDDWS